MTAWLLPLAFGLAASAATALGGLVALRLAGRMATLLAIAAGVVLGVACFDLLPGAFHYGRGVYAPWVIAGFLVAGLAGYWMVQRLLAGARRWAAWRAHLGPLSLTLHSFLDGLLLGLAFQISPQIGGTVAVAVLAHDLADGVNTVGLALARTHRRAAQRWLMVNGLAPLAGVLIGLVVRLPSPALSPVMAAFAGVFLYIGAVELVPRSLATDGRPRTVVQVVAGAALMLGVTLLAG